jgi:hypothetical protein
MSGENTGKGAPANERPESARRRENDTLGVRLFTAAPDGFIPLAASPRELLAYGYPPRPDPLHQPRLHALWTKMMSRPMRIIEPQFAVMAKKARGQKRDYGLPAGNGWCGSVALASSTSVAHPNAPVPDAVTYVVGQWVVPHIVGPKPGNCMCACWVGIDGGGSAEGASGDILQAGTTQQIIANSHGGGDYSSFAWCEWYPGDPSTITNLAVSPGDTMFCSICVSSPTAAVIHLLNVTTGVGTTFTKTAPTSVDGQQVIVRLSGASAEWIVEATVGAHVDLGRFGDIFFDNCLAGTKNGFTLLGGSGNMVPMVDINGNTIAVASAKAAELILIEYEDRSP